MNRSRTTILSCVILALLLTPIAVAQTQETAEPAAAKREIPKGKQTTPGLYVTSKEAYETWKANPDKVKILDVRTTEEFLFVGHPTMAFNVPAFFQKYEWDASKGRFPMVPNPEFLAEVRKVAGPEDTLLVTCRSGGRSAMAVNQLAAAGYKHVYNIIDGVEGDEVHDPDSVYNGLRVKNGWKNSGLPWGYDIDPARVIVPEQR